MLSSTQLWEPMERQLGRHFRGNCCLVSLTCFLAQCLVLMGLIAASFIACLWLHPVSLNLPTLLPLSQCFPCLLLLLYRSINTLWNPAALSSLGFRSSRDTVRDHLCTVFASFLCVCLWVLILLSVWMYFVSTCLHCGCLLPAPALCLSNLCFFGAF